MSVVDVEHVYLGRNNEFIKIIQSGDPAAAVNLSGVTKMQLMVSGEWLVESTNLDTDPIKWAKGDYATGETRFILGFESIDTGKYRADLVLYDAESISGEVWGVIPIIVE